jgi:hypothetical protein
LFFIYPSWWFDNINFFCDALDSIDGIINITVIAVVADIFTSTANGQEK